MVPGWQKANRKLQPTGTPLFLKLWHCGRASHSDFHAGDLPVSASATRLEGEGTHTPLGKKGCETLRLLTGD